MTAIYIVTQEDIVWIGALATDFEKLHQIVELTVNISAYIDWRIDMLNVWLVDQYFPSSFA